MGVRAGLGVLVVLLIALGLLLASAAPAHAIAQFQPSSFLPANGSTVGVARPTIGFTYTDTVPGPKRVIVRLNSQVVFDQVVPQGDVRFKPGFDLSNNTTYAAQATVVGSTTVNSYWSFSVVAAPGMTLTGDCMECHTTYPSAHSLDTCSGCHGAPWPFSYHPNTGPGSDGAPAGRCVQVGCHGIVADTSLFVHGSELYETDPYAPLSPLSRYRSTYPCTYCHSATYPAIPRHSTAGLEGTHQDAIGGSSCEECHSNSLIEEHARFPLDSEFKHQCTLCHASTRVRVQQAIASSDTRCDSCHPNLHNKSWSYPDYYQWSTGFGDGSGTPLSELGSNPLYPGVHGNYLATTAKCGVCHSVHRARGDGVKLLNTAVATCAGCHGAGTSTVTELTVSWAAGGPHRSGDAAQCTVRSCHLDNPHGAGGSQYAIVAAKLLNPATDAALAEAVADPAASGISVADLNADPASTWDEATRSAVRTGYNCNQAGCHVQTLLAVLDPEWGETRYADYDNAYWESVGGRTLANGGYVAKTGHLSVAEAGATAFVPVTSCVSCHDQTDSATGNGATTVSGYTFPHSQTAVGDSDYPGRAYLWMGYAADAGTAPTGMSSLEEKAYDGACLKCHRAAGGAGGVGIDF